MSSSFERRVNKGVTVKVSDPATIEYAARILASTRHWPVKQRQGRAQPTILTVGPRSEQTS